MSHRKLYNKEKWEASKDEAYKSIYGSTPSFKSWAIKFMLSIIGLYLVTYTFNYLFQFDLLTLLYAIPITFTVYFLHELTHITVAILLGYGDKIEWQPVTLQGRFQMEGFDIAFPSKEAYLKHNKYIAFAPYIWIFPYAILSIIIGILMNHYGYIISGSIIFVMHLISIFLEGKTA